MALLVELSGEVPDLAGQEAMATATVLSRGEVHVGDIDGRTIVVDAPDVTASDLADRLGLAHHVSDQAVSGEIGKVVEIASTMDIGPASSFRVRVHRSEPSVDLPSPRDLEADIGSNIQASTGAKVDLVSPEAEVRVVLAQRAHVGLLGGSIDRKALEARAVKHRPFSHPVSIHPKYARAMVNLARVRPGDTVLDPFCGTGGILIEASLMGFRAMGSDIDGRMVEGSRTNMDAMGLMADLRTSDVSQAFSGLGVVPDAIVTDPPYGRSTSLHGGETSSVLGGLYSMSSAALSPGGRLVLCLPSRDMLPVDEGNFSISSVHPMKVHRSLTRHVCVLIREK
ncbi:MAG: RsmD family RNA methyltransferase [Thermoplasmata archaeon]|nr:MAG: RsmD family RNA methyltransferase [Thermoplasmata archaeon]